jgi:hypothetical protein
MVTMHNQKPFLNVDELEAMGRIGIKFITSFDEPSNRVLN